MNFNNNKVKKKDETFETLLRLIRFFFIHQFVCLRTDTLPAGRVADIVNNKWITMGSQEFMNYRVGATHQKHSQQLKLNVN